MSEPIKTEKMMAIPRSTRNILLTLHIVTSVGWLGSVVAFLALAAVGVISQNELLVRASYIDMDIIGRFVIVPIACVSLVIGIIQALKSRWGLVRYYWVLVKFGLTVFATVVLITKVRIMERLSEAAVAGQILNNNLHHEKLEMIIHSGGGLVLLIIITVFSVYKPWGKTNL